MIVTNRRLSGGAGNKCYREHTHTFDSRVGGGAQHATQPLHRAVLGQHDLVGSVCSRDGRQQTPGLDLHD